MISKDEAAKVKVSKDDVEQSVKEDDPGQFMIRNSRRIPPGQFYNHKSQTFKKNKRRGL